jgi:hypothetical protein
VFDFVVDFYKINGLQRDRCNVKNLKELELQYSVGFQEVGTSIKKKG